MANYNQISYGSKGSDVTELQKLLNQNGYNLAEDGIFGTNTNNAVKDYQKNNNLAVDGIVGTNTWGALTKGQGGSTTPNTAATTGANGNPTQTQSSTFSYADYTPSDTVTQAEALLQQQIASKPGEYQSTWADQLNEKISQILNREKFSYDLNGDAIYQQYADQYVQQGKMAMMDTMGQAQAMTGGYGNSYAQSAGQQSYQAYLQQLNDVVPELYGMALDQYNQEGQDMYNQAALMAQQEDQDYGRYRDKLSDYYAELDRLTDDARYQAETDYGKWSDDRNFSYGSFIDDRNYQYQTDRDAIADQQWQSEFDEEQRQYDEQMTLAREQWEWEQEQAAIAAAGGNGNGGDEPVSDFNQAIFSRIDDNGNYVFYIDGKERTYAKGVNPYTGTRNSDIVHGTFTNGYQPNNVGGKKLSKSGITDVVNGVTQNVWKTSDGKLWIWDGTQNKYLEYDDGTASDDGNQGIWSVLQNMFSKHDTGTNQYGTIGNPASDNGARAEFYDPESKTRYLIK